MIKTILIIIISVTIFGIIFFVLVRNALRKKLDILLEEEKKEKKRVIKLFLKVYKIRSFQI